MDVTVDYGTGALSVAVGKELGAGAFWDTVCHAMCLGVPCPPVDGGELNVTVSCSRGEAHFKLRARGTYTELDGTERPSPFWTVSHDGIYLPGTVEESAYLVYCSPNSQGGHGSYKYYRLDARNGECVASYGRAGGGSSPWARRRKTSPLPDWQFYLRYWEKRSKGYIDLTDVFLPSEGDERAARERIIGEAADAKGQEAGTAVDPADAELYAMLESAAQGMVDAMVDADEVTAEMVLKARGVLAELVRVAAEPDDGGKRGRVNGLLVELMCIAPRYANMVSSFMVDDVEEDTLNAAINRESALVDSMEAIVTGSLQRVDNREGFAKLGIGVRLAEPDEVEHIKQLMLDPYDGVDYGGYIPHVGRVWRIDPADQRDRYERYVASRGITDQRELFHGSVCATWFSCIANGLMLEYASAWGMFGAAHYFANQFRKSANYTDGGYWRGGSSGSCTRQLVGVYDVAYGTPKFLHESCNGMSRARLEDRYDCVHALKGDILCNDEVMVYDDAACCIKYLIEIAA